MINFQDARLLTLNAENRFFGDIFRYANVSNITVQGSVYNLTNTSGVAGIWSGINGIVSNANDYDDIQIAGTSFGPGRIDNVRFTEGNDVRQKDYQIALSVFNSGNLYNMGGPYYSGIVTNNLHLIENFSENFSIQIDQNNDYTYEQNVTCRFIANGGNRNTIPIAQTFAASLFQSSAAFGFFTNQFGHFYNEGAKALHRETYNLITNECSFSIVYKQPSDAKGSYSIKYGYQITTDEKGITTVQENGSIIGLGNPIDSTAEAGYQGEIAGAYSRIQAEYNLYAPSGSYLLNNVIITSKKIVNVTDGTIEYSVSYNNDPALQWGNTYSWEYTQEIRQTNCVNTITENGRVKGLSLYCSYADRFSNALAGYSTVKAMLTTRINTFALTANVLTKLRPVNSSESHAALAGEISYQASFTDSLSDTSSTTIKKVETEIVDALPVALVNNFIAFGFDGSQGKEVVQPANIATPGTRGVTVKVYGFRTTAQSDLFGTGIGSLNANLPTGTDPYISAASYTYDATANTLQARASWTFFEDWDFGTVDV